MAETILTKVTYQQSTFTVWCQQMLSQLSRKYKTVWTVSTWVRLSANVIRFRTALHTDLMLWQVAGFTQTFLRLQIWFFAGKVSIMLFGRNTTFNQFLFWMTLPVFNQRIITVTTFATLQALVLACMNIHMLNQGALKWKTSITFGTRIKIFSVTFSVKLQIIFACKELIAHRTQIWLQIVLWRMISGLYSVIVRLDIKLFRMFSSISCRLLCHRTLCIHAHIRHHNKVTFTLICHNKSTKWSPWH